MSRKVLIVLITGILLTLTVAFAGSRLMTDNQNTNPDKCCGNCSVEMTN